VKKFWVILLFTFITISGFRGAIDNAYADVEWEVKKQLRLKMKPLDVASSLDGKYIYFLVEGNLLIYNLSDGKFQYTIPVDKSFDMLTLSERNDLLILTSSASRFVKFIKLDFIAQLDSSASPYRGPNDALVTIISFIDYQ